MLLGGKKFDLRVYVLVTDLGNTEGEPVISFVAEEALVRFCTEDYEKPSSANMHNLLSHLTNYSLNKNSDKFVEEADGEAEAEELSKRTLSSVLK